jgi:basic membrane protein A and related proteins
MIDLRNLSRRGLLNFGATAGTSLVLPKLIRPAHAAGPLPAVPEEKAVIAFGHTGPVADEGSTWSHDQGMKAVPLEIQHQPVFFRSGHADHQAALPFRG